MERERFCRKLCDRNLIACSSDIIQFKISPLGKELLKSDPEELPITSQVLFRLEEKGHIELTSITRAWPYSEEELNAGIPQRAGSRLFFVSVK